jgi:hypothetical protein
VPSEDLAYTIDRDLLATAKLPDETKQRAEAALTSFRRLERSLTNYMQALQENLRTNEELDEQYDVVEAVVGALSGITAIGVVFATGVVVVPIVGAVAIVTGVAIQHYHLKPTDREAKRRLEEAERLADQLPDIERAFDALVFAGDETEAVRRYKRWEAYVTGFDERTAQFFRRYQLTQKAD